MDFIKKNYGLLLFLIICLAVIGYQLVSLMGIQEERTKNKALRQEHLDRLQKVRSARRRLDETSQKKAQDIAQAAKQQYASFVKNLADKRLLPGIVFSEDPDEASAESDGEMATDEDGNPMPAPKKADPFKNLPDRKRFDAWMQGSLADAREVLTNELILMNKKYFKSNAAAAASTGEAGGQAGEFNARKAEAELEKQAKAEGKSTYDVEKEKRMKIIRGTSIPPYFMFEEYVRNRENGLRNTKEKRGVFRQLLLLDKILGYLQRAEISELSSIDFPCGLTIVEADAFTVTPVTLTMTAKPECVESFLNLLNANENYVFVLRDISAFRAEVQFNDDPDILFNGNGDRGGAATLKGFLGGATGKSASSFQPAETTQSYSTRSVTRTERTGENLQETLEQDVKTRKAYRIFARKVEEPRGKDTLGGQGTQADSGSTEIGTRVTVTLNFEYLEYKPVAE